MNRLVASVVALLGVLVAPCAHAAVVVVNQTLDLTKASFASSGFTGVQGSPAFSPPYSVAIAEGDTFDFTIDFLGSQTLTLTNPSFVWAFSYADIVSDVTGTGTLSFLDAAGLPILQSVVKTDTESSVHFGQQYSSSDFVGGLPSSITFSGVRYTGILDDYIDPAVTTRTYDRPAFFFTAGANAVGGVPEPAAWALMLLGFGAVGAALRRQRKVAVSYC